MPRPLSPFAPIHRLAADIAAGHASPVALTNLYLDRIRNLDGKLGAFVDVYGDNALIAAEAAEEAPRAGHRIGQLHGIPSALKDLLEIEGRITEGAPSALSHPPPRRTPPQ